MKTRRLAVGGLFAVLGFVALGFVLRPGSRGVTEAHLRRLTPGMTQAEVERELGGRPRDELKYSAIVWVPQADGKRRSAFIGPGTPGVGFLVSESFRDHPPNEVAPKKAAQVSFFPGTQGAPGRQAVWVTETGLIAVEFGQDGRLRQTFFSTVHGRRPPTPMDWVASRPRMVLKALGR
jgi:hypothetical protein